MINQAPIVRYTAFVSEIFFSDFRKKTFSAESKVMSDLVPHGRHARVEVAPCGSDRSAIRRDVGEHTWSLANRCARIYRYLVAQYLDRDGHCRARHAQELGTNASDHHRNNGQVGKRLAARHRRSGRARVFNGYEHVLHHDVVTPGAR
jgi:hypothetical protein